MKRFMVFVALLAMGVAVSAWLGKKDAAASANRYTQSQLNTTARHNPARAAKAGQPSQQDPLYEESLAKRRIYQNTRCLLPLAKSLEAPRSGDWRNRVREPEQDFANYILDARRTSGSIIVQPVGTLSPDQTRALGHLLDAIAHFFGMPAVCATPIPMENLPPECFRTRYGHRQINGEYLMEHVLQPKVGGDVASVLALTSLDIYPGERWPFESAYGWSSFTAGTAVLSTSMILEASAADKGRNLLRITKLGLHELCHTFTLKHCSKYACSMNGCSDIEENDAKPLLLCPDCLAKISLATNRDPEWHLRSMLELCRMKGFFEDANAYYRALTMYKQL